MLGRRDKVATPAPPAGSTMDKGGLGKGRPTPKRSEAESQRRQRVTAPTSRKEAYRRQRDEARTTREQRRRALASGDVRALPARDRGPVRALVRDIVDARRSVAEFFMVVAVVALLSALLPWPAAQAVGIYVWMIMLLLILIESTVLGLRLRRTIQQRLPGENRKGAILYGLTRSTQLRLLRLPKPRVRPGATV